MSVRFAKCIVIVYGVRTHNADIDTNYARAGTRGERPKHVDLFDIAVLACKPLESSIEEPVAFAASYFQAYLGAINLLRSYLRYNEDFGVAWLVQWTSAPRADLGLTAKEYISQLVSKFHDSQHLADYS